MAWYEDPAMVIIVIVLAFFICLVLYKIAKEIERFRL